MRTLVRKTPSHPAERRLSALLWSTNTRSRLRDIPPSRTPASAVGWSILNAPHCFAGLEFTHTDTRSRRWTAVKELHVRRLVLRLPGPDPLQGALARRDRRPLVRLRLRRAAEAAHVPEVHVHEGVGGAGGGERGDAAVRAAVVAVVRGAVVRVGRVAVVAVRVGSVGSRGRVALRAAQTRLPVAHQHRHGDAPRRRRRVQLARRLQGLVLPLPLALVAAVLEPDLHLVGGELEGGGQVLALGGGQVALLLEAPLQLEDLRLREEHPGSPPAPLLLRRPIRVGLAALRCVLPGHQTAAL